MKSAWIMTAIAVSFSVQAGMTGAIRDNFVSSFTSSCFEQQRSSPANQVVKDQALRDYCACTSGFIAGRLSNDDVLRMEARQQNTDLFIAALGDGSKYCRSKVLGR